MRKYSHGLIIWVLFILVSFSAAIGLLWYSHKVKTGLEDVISEIENINRETVVCTHKQSKNDLDNIPTWKFYRNMEYGFETMCEYDGIHTPQMREYEHSVPLNLLDCGHDVEFYVEPNNTESLGIKGTPSGKAINAQELYNFVYWITDDSVDYDFGLAFSKSLARKHIVNGPKITKEVLLDGIPSRNTLLHDVVGLDNLHENAWIVLNGKRIGFIEVSVPPATRYKYEIHIVWKDHFFTLLSGTDLSGTMDAHSGIGMILSHFRLLN